MMWKIVGSSEASVLYIYIDYQEETSKLFVTILPKKKLFVILIPNLYSNKSNSINKIN